MSKHRLTTPVCCIIVALTLALTVLFMNGTALGIGTLTRETGYEARLFDTSYVHSIDIVMDESDWTAFLESATDEEYVLCTLVIDGEKKSSVGIRAKGNTSLSSVTAYGNDRYSFKVEFDRYDPASTYYGLDKLVLNNNIQDNTLMKDYLTYRMMARMGVASSLASYAWVTVNGEDWGLYLALEGVEEGFLERNFGADYGELYKPDSISMGGGRGNGRDFDMQEFADMTGMELPEGFSAEDMPDASLQPDAYSGQGAGQGGFPGGDFTPPGGADFGGGAPPDSADFSGGTPPDGAGFSGGFSGEDFGGGAPPDSADFSGGTPPDGAGFSGGFSGEDFGGGAPPDGAGFSGGTPPDGAGFSGGFSGADFGGGFSGADFGNQFSMGSDDVSLIYSDDDPDSYANIFDSAKTAITSADKNRLIAALKRLNEQTELESTVDMQSVIKYFAVHNFVVNFDSYTGSMIHNYYLYEKDGVLSMIPWDYNLAFGGFTGGTDATELVNYPIDTPVSGGTVESRPMLSWIFSNEEYTALYHDYMAQLIDFFDSGEFESLFDATVSMISPYVERDTNAFCTYDEFIVGTATLREVCIRRAESIRGQLDGEIPSTSDGQNEDGSTLIDASDLSVSDMGGMNVGGSMGGRGNKGGSANFPGAPGEETAQPPEQPSSTEQTP